MRGSGDIRAKCPMCIEEEKDIRLADTQVELECAYCGKHFMRAKSKAVSRSGLYFCCREHKDLAQRIESGESFEAMRPDHYNSGGASTYRERAFREYPHKCAVCGWTEDESILQVHHIDEDRSNADLDNLIILCPTCHAKLTSHRYKLISRDSIVPY